MEYFGLIFAFGAALTWGIVYAIDQKILTELSPLALLFVQSIVTVIVLAPFVASESGLFESIRNITKPTFAFMGVSLLLTIVANMLILYSIQYLGAATASMLEITYPIFVVLVGLVLFGTFPNPYVLFGGGVILLGAMIVSYFA